MCTGQFPGPNEILYMIFPKYFFCGGLESDLFVKQSLRQTQINKAKSK